MNKTTVVIPNFNGIAYIENCLTSVYESTVPIDVIVVDNGSTDDSFGVVLRKFPKVRVIKFYENEGFCRAVNAGISMATTPYVFLLNNDTVIDPSAIEKLQKDLDDNPNAFSVQAKMLKMSDRRMIDSAGDLYCALGWAFALGKDKPSSRYTKMHRVFSSCAGAALYRRSIFEKIGYFDELHFAYLEDVDVGYRSEIFGYENYADMDALVFHAGSGASGSRYNDFKVVNSARNSIYLIYKNMPIIQIIVNLPFLLLGYLIKILFFARKKLLPSYMKGLKEGFLMSFSKEGRAKKIKFAFKRLGRYIIIEVKLILNIFRRLC